MDRHDELGSAKCHFCPLEVPEVPKTAGWSLVPRYDRQEKKWKGKKYVWRCARCKGILNIGSIQVKIIHRILLEGACKKG